MNIAAPPKGGNSKNVGDEPRMCCDHCKKQGHTKDRCYKLFEYPKKLESQGEIERKITRKTFRTKNLESPIQMLKFLQLIGLSYEQYQQLINLLNGGKLVLSNFVEGCTIKLVYAL
uniref:Uncharacterized protein n=1 Tax=Nelumbo nucifera TaxID=4432 RepID=A0A822XWA3_NELNU|nr:TPA_asm: hypothetical protein HUJ06_024518 [Nelumbo nucifera]